MTKQFYVQLDSQNRITDVIEMPHEGYQPVELAVPLPPGILGGAYELVGGSPIYRIQWDTKEQERQEQIDGLEKALNTLLGITEEADNGYSHAPGGRAADR